MMVRLYHFIFMLLAFTSLSGCGDFLSDLNFGDTDPIISDHEFPPELVKSISEGNETQTDPTTFRQAQYTLGSSSHLLIQANNLGEKFADVYINEKSRAYFVVSLPSIEANPLLEKISLCPLERPWMMLATWNAAHPFDSTGRWSTPGGDYAQSDCLNPEKNAADLSFDISDWVQHNVVTRDLSYGLILRSEEPLTIIGDATTSKPPRFKWKEVH